MAPLFMCAGRTYTIGRGEGCDLRLASLATADHHASVYYNRGPRTLYARAAGTPGWGCAIRYDGSRDWLEEGLHCLVAHHQDTLRLRPTVGPLAARDAVATDLVLIVRDTVDTHGDGAAAPDAGAPPYTGRAPADGGSDRRPTIQASRTSARGRARAELPLWEV